MEKEFKIGQLLTFNVRGNKLTGTYIDFGSKQGFKKEDNVCNIKVVSDEANVSKLGETTRVHKSYLVK